MATPGAGVGVGASLEQRLDDRRVLVFCGNPVQGCHAHPVAGIGVGAGLEQHLDEGGVLVECGGPVQRREVKEVGCVGVGAFPQTTFDVSDRSDLKELPVVPPLAVNLWLRRGERRPQDGDYRHTARARVSPHRPPTGARKAVRAGAG